MPQRHSLLKSTYNIFYLSLCNSRIYRLKYSAIQHQMDSPVFLLLLKLYRNIFMNELESVYKAPINTFVLRS